MRKDDVTDPPTIAPEAAFRRAMIATSPDYFSWDCAAQERYRLALPGDARFRIAELIPYRHVRGKDDGKREGGGTLLDEENLRDIRDNFDPGVVRFRKRRKIVLADGALDGLL
jgi:hypothetical protein